MTHSDIDHTFWAMGSEVRLIIEAGLAPGAPSPMAAAQREQAFITDFAHRLSRFETDSELSAFNSDPRTTVPASALLRAAVTAGVWAAQRSGGLVDPTLGTAIETAGYTTSMRNRTPASLTEALAQAPARRPAHAHPAERWRAIAVDDGRGVVQRPPGIHFDTGGTGKGLCADAVAYRISGQSRYLVDCGGDIAVGGVGAQLRPFRVDVLHPLDGSRIGSVHLARGGVATSGLNVRIWRTEAGGFAHHLLDPATGRPAWTGLVGVTAVSPAGALEAETLSKQALLLGPDGARDVLAQHGGLIVHDDGTVEEIGPLSLRRPATGTAPAAAAPAVAA